jgi:thiol-disulfide isomerase/thioredoxin
LSTGAASFCDKTFPRSGAGARRWIAPADKPIPGVVRTATAGWTWFNLWASWCGPCLVEMPLLTRWRDSLVADGVPIHLELWSIDEDRDSLAAKVGGLPEHLRWLKDPRDLQPLLDRLGVERGSAIPIHALIDPAGMLRCVRVGSLREEAYGAVKSMLVR